MDEQVLNRERFSLAIARTLRVGMITARNFALALNVGPYECGYECYPQFTFFVNDGSHREVSRQPGYHKNHLSFEE